MINNRYFKNLLCNVCDKRISVFNCKVCNTKICNYCCDKIQLGQKTNALTRYNINYEKVIEKCIKCKKYIREEGYEVQCNPENSFGYVCYSNNYDGYLIFSGDVYIQQRKLLEFILDKKVKTLGDNYMIAQCSHIIRKKDLAYSNIKECIKNINKFNDKEDKAQIYELFFNICMSSGKIEEAFRHIDYAINLNYNKSLFYRIKADLLSVSNNWRESYNCYEWSLELFDPELKNNIEYIYLGMAIVASRLNQYDETIGNLNLYIDVVGGNERILETKRELDEGIKIEGLPFDMDTILDVYHMYTVVYLEKNQYEYAEKYLKYSFIIKSDDMENKFLEGRIVQAKKMYKEQQDLLNKYTQLLQTRVQNIYYGEVKMGDVNFNGAVSANVLSTGDNANINYQENGVNLSEVDDLIAMINSNISNLNLSNDENKLLNEKLNKLEGVKRDSKKCKEVLRSMRNIIEGITESIIATAILTGITQILG